MRRALFISAGVVAVLLVAGLVWNWYRPSPTAVAATAAPRPVPVKAAPTRAVSRAEPQIVVREVVRYVPAPREQRRLEDRYDLKLGDAAGEVDLLAEVQLPALPDGGTAAVTVDDAGQASVTVMPKRRPFFQLGGIRESGVSFDPLSGALGVYHQHDIARTGPVVWNLQAFASQGGVAGCVAGPCPPGLNYGLQVRAGIRW